MTRAVRLTLHHGFAGIRETLKSGKPSGQGSGLPLNDMGDNAPRDMF
jgi:hypothetical protein